MNEIRKEWVIILCALLFVIMASAFYHIGKRQGYREVLTKLSDQETTTVRIPECGVIILKDKNEYLIFSAKEEK
jgi:YbbR domain-containing protein